MNEVKFDSLINARSTFRLANINPYTPTVLLESTLRKRARGPVGTNQLQNQDGR